MNLKQIQELIKFVAKSGATEVDLEIGDVKICIKSPPKGKVSQESVPMSPIAQTMSPIQHPSQVQHPAHIQQLPPAQQSPVIQQSNVSAKKEIENDINASEGTDNYITIKSPIIGTFYRRPSPDKDPFVNVGDKVEKGSVVGIVEAMKLFNEIESEHSGSIVKVLIDDMSPVEYDQPLFLLDPN